MRTILNWCLFCYMPFGFFIILSIIDKPNVDITILLITLVIFTISLINTISVIKKLV